MKKSLIATIMLFASVVSFAQKLPPDQIVGIWQSEDFKIEVFRPEDTYSAKLLWAKDMFEADGKISKKDSENPNEQLRSRSRQAGHYAYH